jgi:GTP-binding protein HflX
VEAFKSTLEEVSQSDLIVHVVDGAHPDPTEQLRAVREVITEIGGGEIMEIIAINKADVASYRAASLCQIRNLVVYRL